MSEWSDADGNLLGVWVPCSEEEYIAALNTLTDPVVFAGHTIIGESLNESGFGEPYRDRRIWSEWGNRDADAPAAQCHDEWDYFGERRHAHAVFSRTAETAAA
jgi:hypothetical protein